MIVTPQTTELVSQSVFDWFMTFAVGGVGTWLFFFEMRNFSRLRGKPSSPTKNDQIFGYIIGTVIAFLAVFGTLHYRGWI